MTRIIYLYIFVPLLARHGAAKLVNLKPLPMNTKKTPLIKDFQLSKKGNYYTIHKWLFVVAYECKGKGWRIVRHAPGRSQKGSLLYTSAEEAVEAATALIKRTFAVWNKRGWVVTEKRCGAFTLSAVRQEDGFWYGHLSGPKTNEKIEGQYASAEDCLEALRRAADDTWEGICDGYAHYENEGEYDKADAYKAQIKREIANIEREDAPYVNIGAKA